MQALGLIETRGLIAAVVSADSMLKSAEVTLLEKTNVGGGLVSIAVTGGVAAVRAAVEAGSTAVREINVALLVSQHVIPRPHEELNSLIFPIKPPKNVANQNVESVKAELVETNVTSDKAANEANVANTVTEDWVVDASTQNEAVAENSILDDANEAVAQNPILKEAVAKDSVLDKPVEEDTMLKESVAEAPTIEESVIKDNVSKDTVAKQYLEVTETNSPHMDFAEINKDIIDKIVLEHSFEKAVEVLNKLKVIKLRNLAREYGNMGIAGRTISKADKKTLLSEFKKYYRKNL